ncbi:MAG: cobalamin-binding protein [Candidatus Bathyarchaeota archaeon]|uniref:ABC transporter substrate-binding protein n=2 Tax=Candidatus Bathycorpusculum sp. TaxID=2994959 RepID=UPI0028199F67|nr:cobalamin-binding protein [Candidatus Termiticorpusculum sp.]MCL2292833.1 cobalamin-binding protein [Candidatus Termiticorpusculum sp.]
MKKQNWLIIAVILAIVIGSASLILLNGSNKDKSVTVVDDDGTEVTIDSMPQRIVSLSPSSTELLFAVGAGDQVVGVTDFCDYPQEVVTGKSTGSITSIGNYWQPAIEPIAALDPDLVIASGGGASDEAADRLRHMGYTVIVLNPQTVNDVLANLEVVGKATGHANEASTLINSLQARIDTIASKIATVSDKPQVYVEISADPLMSVGPGSYMGDLVTLSGGVNIFDDAAIPWPMISSESVIAKNPNIILSTYTDLNAFGIRPGWKSIDAVTNSKLYKLDSDNIYVRPGPRFIAALEELSKVLHPDIFA